MRILLRLCFLFLAILGNALQAQNETAELTVQNDSISFTVPKQYNEFKIALSSLVLPGLGHLYCNEKKLGYTYMAGFAGSIATTVIGVGLVNTQNERVETLGNRLAVISGISAYLMYISICSNALKIARRKNIEFQEFHSKQIGYTISPAVFSTSRAQYSPGISFRLNF